MKKYWQINNKAEARRAEILIYEQIGKSWWDGSGVGAKDFITDLNGLDVDDIDLRINSLGGSVFEGNAIYNGLKAHKAKVHVKIDGIAASIASVIAMAGDDIEIPENGMLMIHDPWTYAGGNADDFRAAAEMLDKIKVGITAAYRNKTGKDDKEIANLMTAETWMTAQEAVDMGFADTVTGAVQAQAKYDEEVLSRFRNAPAALIKAGLPGTNLSPIEVNNMAEKTPVVPEITLDRIRAEYPDIVKALQAEGHAEGVKAENSRQSDVRANSIPGHEALIETLANDMKTTGPEAAVMILQAEKKLRGDVLNTLTNDAPKVIPPSQDEPPKMTAEEKAKADWDKNEDLRNEFADRFETYLATIKGSKNFKERNPKDRGEK